MRYRTKVALAIKGDRIEKGTEVELSEDDFKQFDRNDFEVVGDTVAEPEPAPAEVPVAEMTLEQLRAKAKALGLPANGSKADLQERIALHAESQQEDA